MNKKQIETIAEKYVNFTLETNNYTSPALNTGMIEFPMEGLILIHEKKGRDVFLQTKDIRVITGVRL